MTLRILTVGKQHEAWTVEGIERYQKRLRKPYNVEWVLLPHSSRRGDAARQEESERILARLDPQEYVILLDERGNNIDSPSVSRLVSTAFSRGKRVVIVIGGAYGVSRAVSERADFIWSLSKLVLPHQLVRLVLIEQLYRAQDISHGGPYHHE